jgi:cytochrome c biogenesis protein CcmG/thiol:disulfide interchange protein DsbE
MKRFALFVPLVAFAILALFLWRGLSLDPNAMPSALLNKPWPVFSLPTLENSNAASDKNVTEKNQQGKKALVNVWATWCVTCRVEHPFLMQLSQQGILLIGINYKDKAPEAQQWLEEKGNPFQFTIADTEGKLGMDLGVFGAPETYFVDSQGVIRYKHIGDINERNWNDTLHAIWNNLH